MALRTPGRTAALLAAFLPVGLVCLVCASCATQGAGDGSGGNGGGEGADGGSSGGDDSSGPSPDAIVFGVDASLGDDATSSGSDAASGADAPDPPDASDGAVVSKSCTGLPDGTVCGPSPDICHDAQLCAGGACAPAGPKADGFVCATAADDCHTNGTCKAGVCGAIGSRADGYNWTAGDDTARCCGGKPIHADVDSDCGACGIKCNASNGESCSLLGGHYFCRGCVASAACWSGCCSESFTPFSCAASDCAGNCDSALCPTGSHCVSGAPGSSDYCSY